METLRHGDWHIVIFLSACRSPTSPQTFGCNYVGFVVESCQTMARKVGHVVKLQPEMKMFVNFFWRHVSTATQSYPGQYMGTWPPTGWHHPFVIGWSKYRLGLPQSQWIVGSCDWWEFPLFLRGHWQSPCTALMAGKLPAVRAVQGDCERV